MVFFVKILAILCYFGFTYAYSCCLCSIYAYSLWLLLYLCFFLYEIFKYLEDNEYTCKTVQKKASELAQIWNR